MAQRLLLADAETVRDLLTFVGRAARVADIGVRLQASGGVLRVSAATLAPTGLLDQTPTVLGMRIVRADEELVCDLVVDAASLAADPDDPTAIILPETAMLPAWAGITPPQTGWEHVGEVDATSLATTAAGGIALVAERVPTDAGEDVVRAVRGAVWGALDEDLHGAPRGVAFTADALGFIRGDERVGVFRAGRWLRFSASRGHVLSRGPAVMGLTAVRATG